MGKLGGRSDKPPFQRILTIQNEDASHIKANQPTTECVIVNATVPS